MEWYSLVYAREGYTALLTAALDTPYVIVRSRAEFVAAVARRRPTVAYVDVDLLSKIENDAKNVPVVAVVDGSLDAVVRALHAFPWLSNLISDVMLAAPKARFELGMVRQQLDNQTEPHHIIGEKGVGRVALLSSSNRRDARLERLREFFSTRNLPGRMVAALSEVAEEMVTNALYDAPAEAGYFKTAVPRTDDVELPPERACEISYGIDEGSAFVRTRDPFGSLTRARLLAVLERCNHKSVPLDESRGGAGLGLWRVFSAATTIAITVIPGRLTDIRVWIDSARKGRSGGKQLHTVQLFFPKEQEYLADGAIGRFAADHNHDLLDDSFTAVIS